MRLIVIFFMLALMQVSAASRAQNINLKVKNASIIKVLDELSQQSGYHFLYNVQLIKKANTVTISANNTPLKTVLAQCFENQPFSYVFQGKDVIIIAKPIVQQETTAIAITGKVTDEQNQPLLGVTVKVKGAQTSAVTKNDGVYNIVVADGNVVLIFSSIGYISKEVNVSNKKVVNVVLAEQNTGLNEIVVIGYGEVKKRDLTGSVGSVNILDLQKAPVASLDQALAGRIAGVQVASTDGQPGGEGINIVIRGNNSLTGTNTPLYVIDGFPIESPNLNSLNPVEIESIDVLKDASATAVYGARGANGVVIITTKRGKKGDPVISYDGYYGIANVTKVMDLLSPYEFVRLQNEVRPDRALINYFSDGKTLESYKDITDAVDWQKELFQTAGYQNQFISLSGGTDKTKYTVSGSYFDQKGVIISSGFVRTQGRLTLDQQVNNKLKIGVNANYTDARRLGTIPRNQTAKGSSGNSEQFNLLYNAWIYRPVSGSSSSTDLIEDLLDPDLLTGDYRINPLISAQNEYSKDFTKTLTANGYMEYMFTKDLKFRVTGGLNGYSNRGEIFNNSKTRSGSPLTIQGQTNGINGSILQNEVNNYVNENSLTYNKSFNKNNRLNAVAVYSLQKITTNSNGYGASLIPNEILGMSGLDQGSITTLNSVQSIFTLQSLTGRINYNWFNKYLFTATMRADGSSKFSDGNKWGYFPSGAFAWRINDEPFFKNIKTVSNLKLRTSFGITGNNRVSDFGYLSQISTNVTNGFYSFGNRVDQAFFPTNLGNDELEWESTGQLDIGLDIGLWKNRVNLVVDYYQKKTYDLLLNANIAPSTGFNSSTVNIGKTSNQGFEGTLSTININNSKIKWSTDFNITFNKNRIVALTNGEDSRLTFPGGFSDSWRNSGYITRVNYPVTQFYGFVFDGVYQDSDFDKLPNGTYILKSNLPTTGGLVGTATRRLGDAKYKDLNGDGIVNDNDQTNIGTPYPIHTGGLSNNISYMNFDLNVFFQWSYGNEILNANRIYLEGGGNGMLGYGNNQLASFADRWTATNPSNVIPRINSQGIQGVWSSRYIEDASFLRLKTVSLGYNVPEKILKKISLKSLRVYCSGQNIYTWTKYSGMDPEASVKGFGLTPAFDFSAYPNARTLVLGLNVSL